MTSATSPPDESVRVAELLTVIITTSPTPSAPSTDLISTILGSFRKHCSSLLRCRVIVTFDTFDQIVPRSRLKKGRVTPSEATNYAMYKDNAKCLILGHYGEMATDMPLMEGQGEAEFGSPLQADTTVPFTSTKTRNKRVTFIEPSQRLGFGLAVRSALRMVETPYVWVQQHDWALVSDIPIACLLKVMAASESDNAAPVKYVCFPSARMLSYALLIAACPYPELRSLTATLKGDFAVPSSSSEDSEQVARSIPLTPLFLWHDKTHVASTEHYLQRVFPSRLAMMRGSFIEDTVGQRARVQMKEGQWSKWACWLYYPDEGTRLCLRHLQGRKWKGAEAELEYKMRMIALGRAGAFDKSRPREVEDGELEI